MVETIKSRALVIRELADPNSSKTRRKRRTSDPTIYGNRRGSEEHNLPPIDTLPLGPDEGRDDTDSSIGKSFVETPVATVVPMALLFTPKDIANLVKEQMAHSIQAVERKQRGLFAVDENSDSPFTLEIGKTMIPRKFNIPIIAKFDGKGEPDKHVRNHTTTLLRRTATDKIKCLFFRATLKGIAST
ncbi:hypothetical protein CRG98_026057 [Punica granatum]|uniref:Uncharacterized protein n=1 Tax=Punica granatum TaxID=22663 RepID=A0A2I0JB79_PUNGR|nr:hypothetical protein CRG98_026057 [Punica granatum]